MSTKANGLGEGLVQRVVQELADRLVGEVVRIDQLLVGRPLLLELLEGGRVDDGAARLELMDET